MAVRDNSLINDEAASLSALSRAFRHQTVATLVSITNNPDASDTARTMAARTLMEYDGGKPGNTRPVALDDIATLDDDACAILFAALLRRLEARQPGFHDAVVQQVVDQMLARYAASRRVGFTRGPRASAAPALKPSLGPLRADFSGETAPAAPCPPETPLAAARSGFRPSAEVRQLPGTARADRPPSVSAITTYQDDAAPGGTGIHPDVVARSALKNPLADPWRRG